MMPESTARESLAQPPERVRRRALQCAVEGKGGPRLEARFLDRRVAGERPGASASGSSAPGTGVIVHPNTDSAGIATRFAGARSRRHPAPRTAEKHP